MHELDPLAYTAVWIAPLPIETRAAYAALDKVHNGKFPASVAHESNLKAGSMCGHNIIIVSPPIGTVYGNSTAAGIASNMKASFRNLRFGLLVGVAAGLPALSRHPPRDIRLGDVLVALTDKKPSIVPYDQGKETGTGELELLLDGHALERTSAVVRSAMSRIYLDSPSSSDNAELILPFYEEIKASKQNENGLFNDPGQDKDQYYEVDDHGKEYLEDRKPRLHRTQVWYGVIGSGDKLIKDRKERNRLRDLHDLIGIEMEAAGTLSCLPVGVIRGVCDYADPRKNKEWQAYAAAIAAAYAKAVVDYIPIDSRVTQQTNTTTCRRRRSAAEGFEDDLSRRSKRSRTEELEADSEAQEKRDKDRDRISRSLAFENMIIRRELVEEALDGTCEWFRKTPEYCDWLELEQLDHHHGFLWIKGKPGAGKSTLMKAALDAQNAARDTRGLTTTVIDFFFDARGVDMAKSIEGMYRSLLKQLFDKLPRLKSILDRFLPSIPNKTTPTWDISILKLLFQEAVMQLGKSPLTLFIDALDECNEDQIRDMLQLLQKISRKARSKGIAFRICLASRYYPNITIPNQIDLDLTVHGGNSQDMTVYIENMLDNIEVRHRICNRERIHTQLFEKANGVFIWINIVGKMMEKEFDGGRGYAIEQWLKKTPGDLHYLFQDMIGRDEDSKEALILCLQWILFARQPLSPAELRAAILCGFENTQESDLCCPDVGGVEINNYIVQYSKGLAEITKSKTPTVQFIHQSVRDFLLKSEVGRDCVMNLWPGLNEDFEGQSHEKLMQCCDRYIVFMQDAVEPWVKALESGQPCLVYASSFNVWDAVLLRGAARGAAKERFPLLEYSVRGLLYHADKAQGRGIDQEPFVRDFPRPGWIKLYNFLELQSIRRYSTSSRSLYILSEHNAKNLITRHPDKASCFVQGEERYCMPLLAAVATGSHQARLALMKAFADTEPERPQLHEICEQFDGCAEKPKGTLSISVAMSNSVLHNVMVAGDEYVVRFAFAAGFNVADDGWTLLHHAARCDNEAIIQMLLESGADHSTKHISSSWSPLFWAVKKGRADLVQRLLRNGAETGLAAEDCETPLVSAIRSGDSLTIELHLQGGTKNIKGKNVNSATLLWLAVYQGYAEVTRLLLAHDDANGKERDARLQKWAADRRDEGLARILLNCDAGYSDTDAMCRTPVSEAASSGQIKRAWVPLYGYAQFDEKDTDGSTMDDLDFDFISYQYQQAQRRW